MEEWPSSLQITQKVERCRSTCFFYYRAGVTFIKPIKKPKRTRQWDVIVELSGKLAVQYASLQRTLVIAAEAAHERTKTCRALSNTMIIAKHPKST